MSLHAIVVGAGIGGLATAIGLGRAGWDVTVLEKSDRVRSAGAALSLAPNAMAALDDLGLMEKVLEVGVRVVGGEALDEDGSVLKRVQMDQAGSIRHPMTFTLRPRLHAVLQSALARPVTTGARVVAADASKGTVQLADGQRLAADVVVGADGLRSAVRPAVLGPSEPRPLGIEAVRGLADDDGSVPQGFARLLFARGQEAGVASCGGGMQYWYISSPAKRYATVEAAVAALPADVRGRVARTPTDRIRRDELFDRAPAPTWHAGRTVLLGDAVHAMAPHAGQGAAQALVDAAALTRALGPLAETADASKADAALESAFRAYEAERKAVAERAVRHSRRNARVSLVANPLACRARALAIRAMPARRLAKAFGGVAVATR